MKTECSLPCSHKSATSPVHTYTFVTNVLSHPFTSFTSLKCVVISGCSLARWLKKVSGCKDVVILNIRLLSHRIDGRTSPYCVTSIIIMESSDGVILDKAHH